jgi:hypothetical protein
MVNRAWIDFSHQKAANGLPLHLDRLLEIAGPVSFVQAPS